MRSRAFSAPEPWVDKYACQVFDPAPAALASCWQCLSAPARPPRSAPLPEPALVTKNVILLSGLNISHALSARTASAARERTRASFFIELLLLISGISILRRQANIENTRPIPPAARSPHDRDQRVRKLNHAGDESEHGGGLGPREVPALGDRLLEYQCLPWGGKVAERLRHRGHDSSDEQR